MNDSKDEDDVELEFFEEDDLANKISEDEKMTIVILTRAALITEKSITCQIRKEDDESITDDVNLRPDDAFGSGGQGGRGEFWISPFSEKCHWMFDSIKME
mmetsp:Transcript_44517/g.52142  ORF Transcript_44517/g.52142 Transcript_44517/m.52142 type:complete len:101 (+) Transcript_44517:111-413(+)